MNGSLVRVIAVAGLAAFVVLNAWAFATTPIQGPGDWFKGPMDALAQIIPSHRWATVVVADLVLGWVLMGVVMFWVERHWWVASVWLLATFLIGNAVVAVYFISRAPLLARRLRS